MYPIELKDILSVWNIRFCSLQWWLFCCDYNFLCPRLNLLLFQLFFHLLHPLLRPSVLRSVPVVVRPSLLGISLTLKDRHTSQYLSEVLSRVLIFLEGVKIFLFIGWHLSRHPDDMWRSNVEIDCGDITHLPVGRAGNAGTPVGRNSDQDRSVAIGDIGDIGDMLKEFKSLPGVLASLTFPVFQAWGEVGMGQKLFGFKLELIEENADQVLSPRHNA